MTDYRYTYERMRRLEAQCLIPENYTSARAWNNEPEPEHQTYVHWLEVQCGDIFSAMA